MRFTAHVVGLTAALVHAQADDNTIIWGFGGEEDDATKESQANCRCIFAEDEGFADLTPQDGVVASIVGGPYELQARQENGHDWWLNPETGGAVKRANDFWLILVKEGDAMFIAEDPAAMPMDADMWHIFVPETKDTSIGRVHEEPSLKLKCSLCPGDATSPSKDAAPQCARYKKRAGCENSTAKDLGCVWDGAMCTGGSTVADKPLKVATDSCSKYRRQRGCETSVAKGLGCKWDGAVCALSAGHTTSRRHQCSKYRKKKGCSTSVAKDLGCRWTGKACVAGGAAKPPITAGPCGVYKKKHGCEGSVARGLGCVWNGAVCALSDGPVASPSPDVCSKWRKEKGCSNSVAKGLGCEWTGEACVIGHNQLIAPIASECSRFKKRGGCEGRGGQAGCEWNGDACVSAEK